MEGARMEQVLKRANAGEAEAFAELYGRFSRRVFGLCRHLLGSPEEAEDATSEVFLRAQRAMSSYDRALPLPQWLLSIASHYCLDQLRRRRLERRVFAVEDGEPAEALALSPSPLSQLLTAERKAALSAALLALPERYRLVLVLRYENELAYDQIAGALGLTRNHVATLIFRAKKELRRALEPAQKEQTP